MATRKKALPSTEQTTVETPSTESKTKPVQTPTLKVKDIPAVGNPENTVFIGGKPIEIKPTKLKYQRNRTAAFYRIMELYPLVDILAMDVGSFGDDRDGDKAIMDWLIAVTDDEKQIIENYDDIDTETIEKLILIFKRINRINEKDEKLKNLERERKEAV